MDFPLTCQRLVVASETIATFKGSRKKTKTEIQIEGTPIRNTHTHTRWEFIFRAEVHLAGVVLFVDLQHALLVGLEARRVRLLFVRVPFVSRF